MTDAEKEARIQSGAALFDAMGGFHVTGWNAAMKEATTAFTIRREFCHTNATICQGGFITAWLDAAMAQAVIRDTGGEWSVASLEIKVSFLTRVGPGAGTANGRIIRRGSRVAFLEADLFNPEGKLAAKGTSTGLLVPYGKPF